MGDVPLGRIRWLCRRGTRELDALLTAFVEQAYDGLPAGERAAFVRLLACEDDQLWDWLTGRSEPDDEELAHLAARIRAGR